MSKKLKQALAIRDNALAILRRQGTWHEVIGAGKFLAATLGDVKFTHRTPFSGISKMNSRLKYEWALAGKRQLSYGLDVWAGKKVLNIEWDDKYVCF